MLNSKLLHPEILSALAGAGHGAHVLIADGNYPLSTRTHPSTRRVYLNLAPGLVSAADTLRAIASEIPIEAAHVMTPAKGPEPEIFAEFRAILGGEHSLQPVDRFGFYAAASEPDVCLAILTGEQRIYANILLTIGVVPPPG